MPPQGKESFRDSRERKIYCSATGFSDLEALNWLQKEQFTIAPTADCYRCTENTITVSFQYRDFI
jgi:hypothetical protein